MYVHMYVYILVCMHMRRGLNSKTITSCGGRLSAHLLSLHNRAGVAGSRSALTSHKA